MIEINKSIQIGSKEDIDSFLSSNHLETKVNQMLERVRETLTVEDIRQAYYLGSLSPDATERIRSVFNEFASVNLDKLTSSAASKIIQDLISRTDFRLDIADTESLTELNRNAFVEMMTLSQTKAIETAVSYIKSGLRFSHIDSEELMEVIHESCCLDSNRIKANLNDYANKRENLSPERAKKAHAKLTRRQIRSRAKTISSDAILNTYRQTEHWSVEESVRQGVMRDPVQVWSSADDPRVCAVCRALDGTQVGLNETFISPDGKTIENGKGAHPRCRCARKYVDKDILEA